MGLAALAEAMAAEDQSWRLHARCLGIDPDLFFPERGATTREPKSVCNGCEVRLECLQFALAVGEKFGIWGGFSERQRRRIRRLLNKGKSLDEILSEGVADRKRGRPPKDPNKAKAKEEPEVDIFALLPPMRREKLQPVITDEEYALGVMVFARRAGVSDKTLSAVVAGKMRSVHWDDAMLVLAALDDLPNVNRPSVLRFACREWTTVKRPSALEIARLRHRNEQRQVIPDIDAFLEFVGLAPSIERSDLSSLRFDFSAGLLPEPVESPPEPLDLLSDSDIGRELLTEDSFV